MKTQNSIVKKVILIIALTITIGVFLSTGVGLAIADSHEETAVVILKGKTLSEMHSARNEIEKTGAKVTSIFPPDVMWVQASRKTADSLKNKGFVEDVSFESIPQAKSHGYGKRKSQKIKIWNKALELKQAKMDELARRYNDGQVDNLDGVTIGYKDWWFNCRPSNTEPLLRLNVETKSKEMLDEKLSEIAERLGKMV